MIYHELDWPDRKYQCVLADPPWKFATRSEKGLEGRPQHYKRMSTAAICAMPVPDICAKDCWLFLWVTGNGLQHGFRVLQAWGFAYSSVAFNWVKLNPKAPTMFLDRKSFHKGQGYTTRKNAEWCLLGRRGRPRRISRNVDELLIDVRREHSRKPDEQYSRIQEFCAGPRIEIFARQEWPQWDAWGNEVTKFKVAA